MDRFIDFMLGVVLIIAAIGLVAVVATMIILTLSTLGIIHLG